MGKITELRKANGEVLRIIDGEYVIGAGASCQNKVRCPTRIISGSYVVESCGKKTRFFTITDDKQLVMGVDGYDYEGWISNAIKYINYDNFLDNVTIKKEKNTNYSQLYLVTLKKGEFRVKGDYIAYHNSNNLPDDLEFEKVSGVLKEYYNGNIREDSYEYNPLIYITDKAVGKNYLVDCESQYIYTIKA